MNLLTILRSENASLLRALTAAGHKLYAPADYATLYERIGVPAEAIEWPDDPQGLHGWLQQSVETKLQMYALRIPQVIDAVTALHDRVHLDGVIVWTDAIPMLRGAVLAARKFGIPSFEVTHGCFNTYRQGHFECESYVDVILAPGEEEAAFRRFYGNITEIVITGKPSYDWMAGVDKAKHRAEVRALLRLPERRPLIVYAMTWRHPFSTWERDSDWGEADVLQAHMNLQAVCKPWLIIKPHYANMGPRVTDAIKHQCDEHGVSDYSVAITNPALLLPAADLIVSHKSSILGEAVLLDIPCVGFDFRERNDFAFHRNKGIFWVESRANLYPAMARCLLDATVKDALAAERRRAYAYFNGPHDGRAGERCVRVIEDRVRSKEAACA